MTRENVNRDKEKIGNKNRGRITGKRKEEKDLKLFLRGLKSNSPEVEMVPIGFS